MKNLKGLFVFSLTKMLERFGFYAMMSILVISFLEDRVFSVGEATHFYSIFYFSIYISMLLMGLVGDFINRRKVISSGMALMAIGYFLYSFMSKENDISLIIPGALIVIGVGAFKTDLQVQVGDLFKNNVKNGAIGYLIFYSFINLGAVFSPIIALYFRKHFGFDSVFLLSGSVSILAFILYNSFPISFEIEGEVSKQSDPNINNNSDASGHIYIKENRNNVKYGLDKLLGLFFLIFIVPFFWIAYNQNGLVFLFFVRDFIELKANSIETIQTINPIAFVLLSIIGVLFMYFLVKIRSIYSIFLFIGIGMIIVAIGYFIPVYGLGNISGKLSYSYALIPILIITLGEVFISPFLMLGFYHFSPERLRGLFMGLFLFITAIGNMLLFIYAVDYEIYGALHAFQKIVIHVLISAAAVFLFWFLIKKLSVKKTTN